MEGEERGGMISPKEKEDSAGAERGTGCGGGGGIRARVWTEERGINRDGVRGERD